MLFCYQDLIRLVSFNTVCLRDPTQMSPESGAGTPLKKTASHRAPFFFFSFLGGDASESSSARCRWHAVDLFIFRVVFSFGRPVSNAILWSSQLGRFFCRLPRIAQIPLAIFRIRFEPKGACLCGGPSEGDVIVSLCRESPCCQTRPRSPRHGTRSRTSGNLPRAPP